MNPSSFSSISFEVQSAIKFKELAKEKDMTHTELMKMMFECYKYCLDRAITLTGNKLMK